jgi:hypothetical protein
LPLRPSAVVPNGPWLPVAVAAAAGPADNFGAFFDGDGPFWVGLIGWPHQTSRFFCFLNKMGRGGQFCSDFSPFSRLLFSKFKIDEIPVIYNK